MDTTFHPVPPSLLSEFRERIDADLEEVAVDFLSRVSFPSARDITPPFVAAIRGGKRFRALCAAIGAATSHAQWVSSGENPAGLLDSVPLDSEGSRNASNDSSLSSSLPIDSVPSDLTPADLLRWAMDTPQIRALGVALEFYQASALVHDDLLDGADTRRGLPTVHRHFSALHRERGLLGNAEDFGRDGAVLTGDLLLAAADYALARALPQDADVSRALLRCYSEMTGEVAVGQFADTTVTYRPFASRETEEAKGAVAEALAIITRKSARYSVVYPAVLGVIAAGGNQNLADTVEQILEPAGIAFQLRDDALGAFGAEDQTGKPTGIDIVEGKRTVLLALALAHMPEETADLLVHLYTLDSPDPASIAQASALLGTYGADLHEEMIAQYRERALTALDESSLPASSADLLRDLVGTLTDRSA